MAKSNKLTCDALLVPGDLANKACQEGFSQAWDLCAELGRVLKVRMVVPTLGNHDVDCMNLLKHNDPFYVARNLRPGFPFKDKQKTSEFFSDGCCILRVSDAAEVVVLNSVIDHHDEQSAKRGTYNLSRVTSLKQALRARPAPIRVAMLHHHPTLHMGPYFKDTDVIEGGDQLLDALRERGCRFVIHGHRHHASLKIDDSLAIFAAGSFSANLGEFGTTMGNLFHEVHLQTQHSTEWPIRGQIRSWHYQTTKGWVLASSKFSGFPHLAGFGRRTSLDSIVGALETLKSGNIRELFSHSSVLEAAPDIAYLTPTDQLWVSECLQAKGLKIPNLDIGDFQMGRLS
jgi:predicted phosphodiesterase